MKKKVVVLAVGPSGTGKSTFVNALGLSDYIYVGSRAMEDELKGRGLPVNHDTIFELSQEWYAKNPFWQIQLIQKALKGEPFLIIDGARRGYQMS